MCANPHRSSLHKDLNTFRLWGWACLLIWQLEQPIAYPDPVQQTASDLMRAIKREDSARLEHEFARETPHVIAVTGGRLVFQGPRNGIIYFRRPRAS